MVITIYLLLLVAVVGFVVTIIHFLKLFASILSLISIANETFSEKPWAYILTGGSLPMWQVLLDEKNVTARNTLLSKMVFFVGSFAVMMSAGLLIINLNSRHCVFSMSQTSLDETEAVICPLPH